MALPIYATPTELAVHLTGNPDAVPPQPNSYTVRLRQASRLVRRDSASAIYDTDADQYPTDADKREAVREATLLQAEAWIAADIDPAAGTAQLTRTVKSKSLTGGAGGASVTYDDDPGAAYRVKLATGEELIEAAWEVLADAGMVSNRVTVSGTAGRDTYLVGTPYNITTGQLEP